VTGVSSNVYLFILYTSNIMLSSVFWDASPCSPLKVNRHSRGTSRLHFQGWWVSQARQLCLPPVSCSFLAWLTLKPLKMEATCSSGVSDGLQRTTGRYIPEDGTFHNYCWENLKSHKYYVTLKLYNYFRTNLANCIHFALWNTQAIAKFYMSFGNFLHEFHIISFSSRYLH
jgi:hypothetical protein